MIQEQERYHFNLFTKVCSKLISTSNLNLKELKDFNDKYKQISDLFHQGKIDEMHIEMENVMNVLEKKKAM